MLSVPSRTPLRAFRASASSRTSPATPLDGHDLQAVVVVQVDVLGRDDGLLVVVLQVHDPAEKVPLVMIVDEGDGAGHLPALFPLLLDHFLADEVPEGLGAVCVLLPPDQAVEALKQGFFQGYAETDDLRHGPPIARFPSACHRRRRLSTPLCRGGIGRRFLFSEARYSGTLPSSLFHGGTP